MKQRTALATTVLTAGALIVAAAPSAAADIEVGVGIRGVEIGMNKPQARAAVGKPTSKRRITTDLGTYLVWKIGTRNKFEIRFRAKQVVFVQTRAVRDRTPTGLGVGSTTTQVLNQQNGVNCRGVGSSKTLCTVGQELPGEIVTNFRAKNNVVRSVEVGRVID
jgi:hypothetical protein